MILKLFTGLSIYDFQATFGDDKSCIDALSKVKWKDGYSCRYCNNKKYCNTKRYGERRCTSCRKPESATAHTLFHKLRFPPHKAFMMLYLIITTKNGISGLELHRKLGLHKRTCLYFKRKAMAAMASHCTYQMEGDIEVDEAYWGGKEQGKPGRSKGKKKLIVVAIQKGKRGIKRIQLKEIQNAGVKELKPFFEDHIDKNAKITTDKWRTYKSLQRSYTNLIQIPSRGGKNFDRLHRLISSFKSWLRGIHHSVRDLQPYLDEFSYRFNRNQMGGDIFNHILSRMVNYPAVTYYKIFSAT